MNALWLLQLASVLALPISSSFLDTKRRGDALCVQNKKVLLVDVRGPTRRTGDGVRTMGMIMDLLSDVCHITVDVLVSGDAESKADMWEHWGSPINETYLTKVKYWPASSFYDGMVSINDFDRIIIGGKLDLLYTSPNQVVLDVMEELYTKSVSRAKVEVFWDDVPFERCLIRKEAAEICPKVKPLVARAAQISHQFYVLSKDDQARLTKDMNSNNIALSGLSVGIWPMRLKNMKELLPSERFFASTAENSRSLVAMMGAHHSVNKMMVSFLFESGAIGEICKAIKSSNSNVRIVFLGGLATDAHNARVGRSDMDCVQINEGFIEEVDLKEMYLPFLRAYLNPFFKDVNSGISVKNFESIMSGTPVITSSYGMHGFSDEIEGCKGFPMPDDPENAQEFVNYVIDHVIDDSGYATFLNKFQTKAENCIQGQMDEYPIKGVCQSMC